ncbi:hypothetical protein MKW92_016291 [Papaver armeniacum]|nr:hypothetical protein MKW92_016291 [Papaver armeniacum]
MENTIFGRKTCCNVLQYWVSRWWSGKNCKHEFVQDLKEELRCWCQTSSGLRTLRCQIGLGEM